MEDGWSARRVACQLGLSDSVVRRSCNQWIQEKSFTRRPGSDDLDRPVVEKTATSRVVCPWYPATACVATFATFQQDSVRPYTAGVSQDCLRTVTTIPWPTRSPDLSPI
ncbi:hypothetical protein TNCV_3181241 [Trichonephila clavipes]|nr:hypothetical protein TNCV_3181241 [Trichonephila clavipes]